MIPREASSECLSLTRRLLTHPKMLLKNDTIDITLNAHISQYFPIYYSRLERYSVIPYFNAPSPHPHHKHTKNRLYSGLKESRRSVSKHNLKDHKTSHALLMMDPHSFLVNRLCKGDQWFSWTGEPTLVFGPLCSSGRSKHTFSCWMYIAFHRLRRLVQLRLSSPF